MAIGEHKRKSPYHGIWIVCIFMIAIPVGLYFLFRVAFVNSHAHQTFELNEAVARAIAFGVGLLFHLSLVIAGVFENSLGVVINRIVDFFENCKISFKLACSCYVDHVKEYGLVFWILLSIMVADFCLFWSGFRVILEQLLG